MVGIDLQSKPPSDLVAVLGDHFALNADRYGLDADALRLERVYGSGVRRSFRVHDDDNSIHVKLWPATRRSVWEQWFAVREVLESRYQAPRIMGLVDLPDIAKGGLVFEHIEGMPPVSGSYTGLLLDLALRLHADRELAPRIGLLRGAETVGQTASSWPACVLCRIATRCCGQDAATRSATDTISGPGRPPPASGTNALPS